jgi:hypothetical protein
MATALGIVIGILLIVAAAVFVEDVRLLIRRGRRREWIRREVERALERLEHGDNVADVLAACQIVGELGGSLPLEKRQRVADVLADVSSRDDCNVVRHAAVAYGRLMG